MPMPHTNHTASGLLRAIATRPAKRVPMRVHDVAEIDRHAGLHGDFGRKPGKAQVTVLSEEAWQAACGEVGVALAWTLRRANLLVTGIPVQPVAGARITIGAVVLEVTGETDPCRRMEEAHPGLQQALTPEARGGVRCRVLTGGRIRVGDSVAWMLPMGDLFDAPDAVGL